MKYSKFFSIFLIAMVFVVSCNKATDKDVNDNPHPKEKPKENLRHPSNFIVEATIIYEQENKSDSLSEQSKYDLSNEKFLLPILHQTIDTLQLSYTYSRDIDGGYENIYKKNPVTVFMDSGSLTNLKEKLKLEITKTSDSGVKIIMMHGEDNTLEATLDELPGTFDSPFGKIFVTANDTLFSKMNFIERVIIKNPATVLDRTLKNLKIIPKEDDSICHLIYFAPNSDLGIDVLNMIKHYCNKQIIEDKNRPYMQKEEFILVRLKQLQDELKRMEENLREYSEQHNTYKKPSDPNIDELKRNESLLITLLAQVKDVQIDPKLMNIQMISTIIDNRGILSAIEEFNKAARIYNNIRVSLPDDNELLAHRIKKLVDLRADIVKKIELSKQEISQQINNASMLQLPNEDTRYQKLLRDKSNKEQIYLSLLQKRKEIALQKTSVSPKFEFDKEPQVVSPVDLFKIISSIKARGTM